MQRRRVYSEVIFLLTVLSAGFFASICPADEGGWKTLFDGKSLDGWDGNPAIWRDRKSVV